MDHSTILENYLSNPRTTGGDRDLLKTLSSWEEDRRVDFLEKLAKTLPSVALPFAGKCLREKGSFRRLLLSALAHANASDMKYWIDCIVPRLGLESVTMFLDENRSVFPKGVERAEYFLSSWKEEDESWLVNPMKEFLGRCDWEGAVDKSQYLELNAAPGSSFDQVRKQLDSGKTCVCMIVDFIVFVHHSCFHGDLLKSVGAEWMDSPGDGNFSADKEGFIFCRWKRGCDPLLSGFAEDLIRGKFDRKNCVEK